MLKGEYTVQAIQEHNMDKAIIFCRTKVDCDNMERYLNQQGGGKSGGLCGFTSSLIAGAISWNSIVVSPPPFVCGVGGGIFSESNLYTLT